MIVFATLSYVWALVAIAILLDIPCEVEPDRERGLW